MHTAENISDYRITALGGHMIGVKILYDRTIEHSAGRIYLHAVIENINMNLAADFHIVAVDQCINCLLYTSTATPATELMRKLKNREMIERVKGRGKYRFSEQQV